MIKYLIHRAPDFFDWRSGVYEFPKELDTLELESWRIIDEGDYQKYLTLTPAEKNRKILQIEELLAEDYQTPSYKAKLLFELGNLLVVQKQYKEALASYDQALNFKPDDAGIFYNKACCYALQGNVALALENLERAIKPNPEKYREMAKTDSYFDTIRDDIQFQVLIQ